MRKQNIVLVGFHGCGKKRFGRELAKISGLPFAALDEETSYLLGENSFDFVNKYGWQVFRELEQRVVHDFSRNFSGVLATATTCIENSKNLDNLKKTGLFVFLNPDFDEVKKGLIQRSKNLPFMRLNDTVPLDQELEEMYRQRKNIYQAVADIEVNPDMNGDPREEAKKILRQIAQIGVRNLPMRPEKKKVAIFCDTHVPELEEMKYLMDRGRIPHVDFTLFVTNKPCTKMEVKAKNLAFNEVRVRGLGKHEEHADMSRDLLQIMKENEPDAVVLKSWNYEFCDLFRQQFGQTTYMSHPVVELGKFDKIPKDELFIKILEENEKYAGCTIQRMQGMSGDRENVLQRKILIHESHTPDTLHLSVARQVALGFCELLERR